MKDYDCDSYFMGYIDGSTDRRDNRPSKGLSDNAVYIILGIIWLISLLSSCSV